jgi:polysaccharide biosynthesis protein PslH
MRVLYLTYHLPWPPYSGGRLREAKLLRRLAVSLDIELVAVAKTLREDLLAASAATMLGIKVHVFGARAGRNPLNGPLVRRHYSAAARRYLAQVAERQDFDIMHVEGHFLSGLLPTELQGRAVLVEHNVESSLFAQQLVLCDRLLERIDLWCCVALTSRDDLRAWRAASSIVAVTEADATAIKTRLSDASVCVAPDGFDHLGEFVPGEPQGDLKGGRVDPVMVGNYAYRPSKNADLRLLSRVFPLVAQQRPAMMLALVGNYPSERMRAAAGADRRITITGCVYRTWVNGSTLQDSSFALSGLEATSR